MSQVITASNTVRAHMPHMRAATRWLLVWMLCGTAPACGGNSSPRQFVTRDSAGVRIVESSAPAWADGDGWTVEANHRTQSQASMSWAVSTSMSCRRTNRRSTARRNASVTPLVEASPPIVPDCNCSHM